MWLVATILDNKDPSRLCVNQLPITITKQQDRLKSFRPWSLGSTTLRTVVRENLAMVST